MLRFGLAIQVSIGGLDLDVGERAKEHGLGLVATVVGNPGGGDVQIGLITCLCNLEIKHHKMDKS